MLKGTKAIGVLAACLLYTSQCVGCGEMKGKKEMMRVLKTAEGDIVLDVTGKKNGRGAYL